MFKEKYVQIEDEFQDKKTLFDFLALYEKDSFAGSHTNYREFYIHRDDKGGRTCLAGHNLEKTYKIPDDKDSDEKGKYTCMVCTGSYSIEEGAWHCPKHETGEGIWPFDMVCPDCY